MKRARTLAAVAMTAWAAGSSRRAAGGGPAGRLYATVLFIQQHLLN